MNIQRTNYCNFFNISPFSKAKLQNQLLIVLLNRVDNHKCRIIFTARFALTHKLFTGHSMQKKLGHPPFFLIPLPTISSFWKDQKTRTYILACPKKIIFQFNHIKVQSSRGIEIRSLTVQDFTSCLLKFIKARFFIFFIFHSKTICYPESD